MGFAVKVRMLLAEKRYSQGDLARALGTSQTKVSRWLTTSTPPKPEHLLAIARIFGVTADYLIDDTQDTFSREPEIRAEDQAVLAVVHALGLSADEAIRRLAATTTAEHPRTVRLIQKGGV